MTLYLYVCYVCYWVGKNTEWESKETNSWYVYFELEPKLLWNIYINNRAGTLSMRRERKRERENASLYVYSLSKAFKIWTEIRLSRKQCKWTLFASLIIIKMCDVHIQIKVFRSDSHSHPHTYSNILLYEYTWFSRYKHTMRTSASRKYGLVLSINIDLRSHWAWFFPYPHHISHIFVCVCVSVYSFYFVRLHSRSHIHTHTACHPNTITYCCCWHVLFECNIIYKPKNDEGANNICSQYPLFVSLRTMSFPI